MNKSRIETISDGVFAIVMTILVFDVRLPAAAGAVGNAQLWMMLGTLWPVFVSYVLSFLVLSVFWINHHFLFHTFARTVNRQLNLLNMVYLMFLAFVPFSARLLGTYQYNQVAVIVYGLNILAIVLISAIMVRYIAENEDMRNAHISKRLRAQAKIRSALSIGCYVLGLAVSFVSLPLSIALYVFPMIFNVIPGTLDLAERVLPFDLG